MPQGVCLFYFERQPCTIQGCKYQVAEPLIPLHYPGPGVGFRPVSPEQTGSATQALLTGTTTGHGFSVAFATADIGTGVGEVPSAGTPTFGREAFTTTGDGKGAGSSYTCVRETEPRERAPHFKSGANG